MKFGVIVFPGSNCDRDIVHVLQNVMKQEVKMIWHKETSLDDFDSQDCIVLPGGFSYGDYLRSGAIARFSPIMNALIAFANKGGYVFGICNGFQILCEAGLLPGALLRNRDRLFICKNVFIKPATNNTVLTSSLSLNDTLKIPIAHAEGRFYADEKTIEQLKRNDQIIFKYCSEHGDVNDVNNINGSLENIAGICNSSRNVFGMMPHPERAAEQILSNTDGYKIFSSLIHSMKEHEVDVIDNILS